MPASAPSAVIGKPLPRVEAPLKVSGTALYTSDHHFPGMLYAVPVPATIAAGTVSKIDAKVAAGMPGVKAIYTRDNIGTFYRVSDADMSTIIDETRPPLEDDEVRYYGQFVALAVADSFEQASAAARAVKVSYRAAKHDVGTELASSDKPKPDTQRGDPEGAFASAAVKVDATYITPVENHNPIELHATVALYDGSHFTVYETTQAVGNHARVLADMLGVPRENVRVITKYLGSGFGGKLWAWNHSLLAAAAARNLRQPVKLVVSRKMEFTSVGHRPLTQQRVRLGASGDGKLVAVAHDYLNHTSLSDDYKENCGEATGHLYSCPNLRATSLLVRRNVGTPTSMRGPGAVPGLFALESAMDELAVRLKLDPVELRLRNDTLTDESNNLPFTSRHLKECLTVGAEKFGWARRDSGVGAMRRDGLVVGWGVGCASWIANHLDTTVRAELHADGRVRIACGTQDIGTGTYTMCAQIAAEKTGVPLDRIDVVLGDSSLPPGPFSGGSMVTASIVTAVSKAVATATQALLSTAAKKSFKGKSPQDLALSGGRVHLKNGVASDGPPFEEVLQGARLNLVSGMGENKGNFTDIMGITKPKKSSHSFGAHFAEVTWQPEIARLRVSRVLTVIDAGKIINTRTGRNQIEGAVAMGIGMALFEHTHYDPRNGAPINSNLADYVVSVNADVPKLEVEFLDYPDLDLNELGARGIGEIGLAGTAAAICSAVYHATGVRVRKLPVKIEDLLESKIV